MKARNRFFLPLLLCFALLAGLVGCEEQPPTIASGVYDGKTVVIERTVTTDVFYADDITPTLFVNGYSMFYDRGTVDAMREFDEYPGDTYNYMDVKGKVLLTEPVAEGTQFGTDGLAVVKRHFYTNDAKTETATEYLVINTSGETVEVLPDEAAYVTRRASYEDRGERTEITINSRGLSLDTVSLHTKGEAQPIGITTFLTDDLILQGYGAGHYGYGDYFKLYNTNGDPVTTEAFTRVGSFENGLAPMVKDGKLGLIDQQGKTVIPPTFAVGEPGTYYTFGLSSSHILVREEDRRISIYKVSL